MNYTKNIRKIIMKDINNGVCKLSGRAINIKMANGILVSGVVSDKLVIEYLSLSQKELEEKVPRYLNKDFYRDYKEIRAYYRNKAKDIRKENLEIGKCIIRVIKFFFNLSSYKEIFNNIWEYFF